MLSLVGLVLVPIDFLPLPNEGVLLESFTLPPGSSLLDTRAAADAMTGRLRADPAVAHVYARIGSSANTTYTEPAYAGEMMVALRARRQRQRPGSDRLEDPARVAPARRAARGG